MSGRRRLVAAVSLAAITGATATVAVVAVDRLSRPLPAPRASISAPAAVLLAAGTPPVIPTPPSGSLMLVSAAGDVLAAAAAGTQRPIASVAKTMTALMVLRAHPLRAGDAGPTLTMTAQDVSLYELAVATGGSAVPVRAGERLSERDLLLALLLPSGNNIADTLARWVAGTAPAFTALENSAAASLGMTSTHFADASGVSAGTVSSARDLVILARAAMSLPAFAAVVATRSATLPDGTALPNLDILLGTDPDWLGVKTGWTGAAGGCLLFAARRTYAPGTAAITVYGAVLGQPPDAAVDAAHPELGGAFAAARGAASAALDGYAAADLGTLTPAVSGTVTEPWGGESAVTVRPVRGLVVARRGQVLTVDVHAVRLAAAPPAGATVAVLRGTAAGVADVGWTVVTAAAIAAPSAWWRFWNG